MRKHLLVFAYVAAIVPALLMAITQPVWSRIDEAQHADFIVQLSHGVYPVADQTLISAETLQVMKSTGVYRGAEKGTYPQPDLSDLAPPPAGMSVAANAVWMSRHMWQLSFESAQTPAFYVLMVPVWSVADRIGGPFAAIYTVRVIDALLIAALAPMAVAVARILVPARWEVAALAAVFAVLLPGLALNGTRISNDALSAALGGLAVLLMVSWAGTPWTWRRVGLMGVILGLGLMVKLTMGGLIPAVFLSALWPGAASRRANFARATVSSAIALLCLSPWFLLNLQKYGAFMPGVHSGRLSDALPGQLTPAFIALDIAVFHITYWTGEPWGALPLTGAMIVLGGLIALMALAGVVSLVRSRALPVRHGPLAVAGAALAGLIAVSLLLPATVGFEFAGPGRYAYPALPAAATLCAIGMVAVLPSASARRALAAVYVALAVAMLAGAAAGLPSRPEAGPRTPPALARTVAVSGSGQFAGVTITVDRVALDPGAKATWFGVTVTNSGAEEAEWTVAPVVSDGEVAAGGQYLKSTQMPGDIDAGQTLKGWLYVPLDPSGLRDARTLQVTFHDVTADGYRSVGDIVVAIPIDGQLSV